jgi:hypothetical protein
VGVNFACRAAVSADARSIGCPETARADKTSPSSLTVTCTTTVPLALTALAADGYVGLGKLVALPFKTPPLIAKH